ncbi:MAG: hypothetical protein COA94_01140 [Rickettsiales bacterium]|nr:MAG: hypothetical protein COA94_01140 [Rickettsiales bacterium]
MNNISLKKSILLLSLANLFFFFQFILRLSAGVFREDIMQRFAVDVASFGTLAGYYYLGYAGAQIPLGIMLDRLSFRFVTSLAIAITSIGTLLFATAMDWGMLVFARFLIGIGSGVAFISIVKIIKTCFDPKHTSMLIGFSFTCGLLGAVFGVIPMRILFDNLGYEDTFYALAIFGFFIAAIMFIFAKTGNEDRAGNEDEKNNSSVRDSLKSVMSLMLNPTILIIGISGGLMVGALEGFADVWALSFFHHVFAMSRAESAAVTSSVYIGMCVGGPLLAMFANILRSTNLMIFITGMLTIIVFMILFYVPSLSVYSATILMFFLGILCCYQALVFITTTKVVSESSAALAIAVVQCINMSFGHFFHSVIANIFVKSWDGMIGESGGAIYTLENYIYALAIIPIGCGVGQFGFVYLSWRAKKRGSESAVSSQLCNKMSRS